MKIAELKREAIRRLGEGTIVHVQHGASFTKWWIAWASLPEGEEVHCASWSREDAKRMLLACIRGLAPRKGARR